MQIKKEMYMALMAYKHRLAVIGFGKDILVIQT